MSHLKTVCQSRSSAAGADDSGSGVATSGASPFVRVSAGAMTGAGAGAGVGAVASFTLGECLGHPRDGEVDRTGRERLLRRDVHATLDDLDVQAGLLVEALIDRGEIAGELRLGDPLQLQLDLLHLTGRGGLGGRRITNTKEIGAAVEFLGCDGLIAPCARWSCDNLILFPDRMGIDATMEIVHSEAVDWVTWATRYGLIT